VASDVVVRKVTYLVGLCDQNGDGFLEMEDFEMWIDRLAAIRSWAPGTEGYQRLEKVFLEAAQGLLTASGDDNGRAPISAVSDAITSIAEAGGPELDGWADGFFQLLDGDEDGVIGPAEYRDLMASVSIDSAEADQSFTRLDLNGDDQLSKEEFTRLYRDFFHSDDPDAPGSWLWGRVPY
jgi:hypothetical protein